MARSRSAWGSRPRDRQRRRELAAHSTSSPTTPRWADWSQHRLAAALDSGPVLINPIIHAEISLGFDRIEDLDAAIPTVIEREPLPWEAGFLAGRCFLAYRRRGGERRSPLPDFYIGAHAATTGRALLTRDPRRYADLFPTLTVVAPGQAD